MRWLHPFALTEHVDFPDPRSYSTPQTLHKRQQSWHQGLSPFLSAFSTLLLALAAIRILALVKFRSGPAVFGACAFNKFRAPYPHSRIFTTGHGADVSFGVLDSGLHLSISAILAVRSSKTITAARATGKLGARVRVGRAAMLGDMGIRELLMDRRG